MKKHNGGLGAWMNGMSVQRRIFFYFLLFVAVLLVLLWLFQIVFLDDFYRMSKTRILTASSEAIARNIDNPDLQSLAEQLSQRNDVCVLVLDGELNRLISCEASPGCVLHHMSGRDLRRCVKNADEGKTTLLQEFPMAGFQNFEYDEKRFEGRVPPAGGRRASSMLSVQKASLADGTAVYVFLNAVVTPVDATVQTLRNQLLMITAVLILLSFLLSTLLSRRVTSPIVQTTLAARELPKGRFEPVRSKISYREITELNQTLTQAARELSKVETLQRELIANISHDLRTPLTLIGGYAEVMRDLPGENTPENIQVIIDEVERLSTLVSSVLDASQLQSGAAPIQLAPFDLTADILAILTRYQKLTEQDGFQIAFEYDRHAMVTADEVKIGQVIYNLINNAVTYTGADKRVTVRQSVEGGRVRIAVIDTGEGIPKDELETIWNRYYRGQKPHKRAAIGSGLGLSIVRGVLESHGLEYGVSSEEGRGSEFYFWLELETGETETGTGTGTIGASPLRP